MFLKNSGKNIYNTICAIKTKIYGTLNLLKALFTIQFVLLKLNNYKCSILFIHIYNTICAIKTYQ